MSSCFVAQNVVYIANERVSSCETFISYTSSDASGYLTHPQNDRREIYPMDQIPNLRYNDKVRISDLRLSLFCVTFGGVNDLAE
jgi:hypothetical protein